MSFNINILDSSDIPSASQTGSAVLVSGIPPTTRERENAGWQKFWESVDDLVLPSVVGLLLLALPIALSLGL